MSNLLYTTIPLKLILPYNKDCGKIGIIKTDENLAVGCTLRCLSYCIELSKYFLISLYKNEINRTSELDKKSKISKDFFNKPQIIAIEGIRSDSSTHEIFSPDIQLNKKNPIDSYSSQARQNL